LHESIDWPKKQEPARPRRRTFFILIALFALVILTGRTAIAAWVDLLWYRSLGYEGVFWKTLGLEWGIFAAFFVGTFLILTCPAITPYTLPGIR